MCPRMSLEDNDQCREIERDVDEAGEEDDSTAFRLGVDIEVNTDDEEIVCQHYRVKKIENIEKCRNLKKFAIIASCVRQLEGLDTQRDVLEHLEVYQGLVKEIRNVNHLTNLRVLDLSFNKISKIEGIDELVKLEKLYLSNNRISVIENLGTLRNLIVLELGSNRIRRIEGLGNLKNLQELWLGKNKIESMHDLDEFQLPKLGQVSLQSNRLCDWSATFFRKVAPNVTNVYLSNNALPNPPEDVMNGLNPNTLEELDLSYNKLTEIPTFTKSMHVLEELWLNDNCISTTESFPRLKDALPILKTIYMERNPVQIGCPLDYRSQLRQNLPKTVTQVDATMILEEETLVLSSKSHDNRTKSILKQ